MMGILNYNHRTFTTLKRLKTSWNKKKREKNVVVGIPRLRLFLYDTYVVFPLQIFPGKFSESKKWSTKLYTRQ